MSVKAKIRIGTLVTSGDVKTEIARVYRQARRGQLDTSEGTKLVYMLRVPGTPRSRPVGGTGYPPQPPQPLRRGMRVVRTNSLSKARKETEYVE